MTNNLDSKLINRLMDTDLNVRVAALYALNNRMKKKRVVDGRLTALLLNQASNQDSDVRSNAFLALRTYIDGQDPNILGKQDLRKLVKEHVHDPSEIVRSASMFILSEILLHEKETKFTRHELEELLGIAYNDPSEDVKTSATYVLSILVIKDISKVDQHEIQDKIEILCKRYRYSVFASDTQRKTINDALGILTGNFIRRQTELRTSLDDHVAACAVELLFKRDEAYSHAIEGLTAQVEEFNKELIKIQVVAKSLKRQNDELTASKGLLEQEVSKLCERVCRLENELERNPFLKHLILPSGFRYAEYVLKYKEVCSTKLLKDLGWHALVRLPLLLTPYGFVGTGEALDLLGSFFDKA